MRRWVLIVLGLVVATEVGLGSLALASVPDSQGVIHACYNKTGGALRVVDTGAGQTCTATQVPIQWSQGAGVANNPGRYRTLPFGAIEVGGTPQLLMSVPGWGEVRLARCATNGDRLVVFTNTSGKVMREFFSRTTMSAGASVGSPVNEGSAQFLLSIGTGTTSRVIQIGVQSYSDSASHFCAFHGIALL